MYTFRTELPRVRDRLMNQLRELNKTKSRGKMDENLMGEVNRLESSLTVARDDLVSHMERYAAVVRQLTS
jgi:structural maintenance of chromosome 1